METEPWKTQSEYLRPACCKLAREYLGTFHGVHPLDGGPDRLAAKHLPCIFKTCPSWMISSMLISSLRCLSHAVTASMGCKPCGCTTTVTASMTKRSKETNTQHQMSKLTRFYWKTNTQTLAEYYVASCPFNCPFTVHSVSIRNQILSIQHFK